MNHLQNAANASSQLLPHGSGSHSYSEKREHSKESSTAYSFVSSSSTNTLQRVILLDDTDTMSKFKKYSLSPPLSKKTKNNRLIFQIRIEFIKRKKHANDTQSQSSSAAVRCHRKSRTDSLSSMPPKASSVTPSDAYSVVSVDSASISSQVGMKKKRKLDKNGKRRKRYKFCACVSVSLLYACRQYLRRLCHFV